MPELKHTLCYRAVAGAVLNALDGHPDWRVPPAFAQSVAKRAARTLMAHAAPAADCQGEYPRAVTAGESDALRAAILASSKVVHGGCMANPAPMAAERGARPIAGSMIKSRLALAALLLLPLPAAAQTMPCAPFRALTATLKDAAGEQPVTEALGADGKLWVTFVARGGATWTLVSVDAQGRACMVMIGKGFGVSRPEPEGQPS